MDISSWGYLTPDKRGGDDSEFFSVEFLTAESKRKLDFSYEDSRYTHMTQKEYLNIIQSQEKTINHLQSELKKRIAEERDKSMQMYFQLTKEIEEYRKANEYLKNELKQKRKIEETKKEKENAPINVTRKYPRRVRKTVTRYGF
uniref:MADS-box transcription factor 18-like n=1 Tax=Saccoglossus kowalevskii TaxID=10224 RepID=A0ABM0MJE8_SACKO|nr:PREDICTED: MADS-box transcription factor 18-like [Saccoglossus kowalevskii]